MTIYLTAFLIVGSIMAVVTHFVTSEPMPWWPDTAIMGATFGSMAALGMIQHQRFNRQLWSAMKGAFRRL